MEGRRENHQRRIRAQLEMRQGEIWVAVLRGAVHNTVGYTKQRQGKIFVRPEEALYVVCCAHNKLTLTHTHTHM